MLSTCFFYPLYASHLQHTHAQRFFAHGSLTKVPNSTAGRRSIDVRVDGRRTVDNADIAHHWALQGHGIIYKSELDLQDSLATGQLVRLFEDFQGEDIPLNAVMPSNRFVPARVRGVVEFLRGKFAYKRYS
jgi:DNA-binding transcriptional LysR family regulator